jgi:hypothetical protein
MNHNVAGTKRAASAFKDEVARAQSFFWYWTKYLLDFISFFFVSSSFNHCILPRVIRHDLD